MDDDFKEILTELARTQNLIAGWLEEQERRPQMSEERRRELEAELLEGEVRHERWRREMEEGLQQTERVLADTARQTQENNVQARRIDGQIAEINGQIQELNELRKQNEQLVADLGQQIGGLGRKFGGFTEGMAFPSMEKILRKRFGMEVITTRVKARQKGEMLEIDVLAYANHHKNEAFVVEVKSSLKDDGIDQILKILKKFPDFFPEHRGKKLYGILAMVDAPADVRARALREGLYLARIHDETFEIQVPESFVPRAFGR